MNIRAMLNKAYHAIPSVKDIEVQMKNPTAKGQVCLSACSAAVGGVGHAVFAGVGIALQSAVGFTYDNVKEIMLTEALGGGFVYGILPALAAYNQENIFLPFIGPAIYFVHPFIGRGLYSLVSEPASSFTDAPYAISPFYLAPLAVGLVMFGHHLCQKHLLAADTDYESPDHGAVKRRRD